MSLNIVVFSKAPVPGEAKRRLIPALGAAGAAHLSARMIRRVVREAVASDIGTVNLWCAGGLEHPVFEELSQIHGIERYPQAGEDLGERMRRALEAAVGGAGGSAVIVGTDCPDLTSSVFKEVAGLLRTHDAVLGPALDGGYVLLAVRSVNASLFENIPWSTGEVATLTRNAMRRLGWHWAEVGPFPDIDRPGDLAHLPAEFRG